ncbi:hypothetical protein BN128_105 [Cronobacter sakazakii 696]|nr:hypothetical protein BN129_3866 [Cronobacter sakazakii 701]CCK06308.1 hypothetical protein BN128_105 [Cronobacter sakazakii 696]
MLRTDEALEIFNKLIGFYGRGIILSDNLLNIIIGLAQTTE